MNKQAPILIVDDDRSNINVFGAMLPDYYDIIVALGDGIVLFSKKISGTWRATSQVKIIRFSVQM